MFVLPQITRMNTDFSSFLICVNLCSPWLCPYFYHRLLGFTQSLYSLICENLCYPWCLSLLTQDYADEHRVYIPNPCKSVLSVVVSLFLPQITRIYTEF